MTWGDSERRVVAENPEHRPDLDVGRAVQRRRHLSDALDELVGNVDDTFADAMEMALAATSDVLGLMDR